MNPDYRFVFDTNVLVSAFLFKNGVPRAALDLAMDIGQLIRSEETINELWEVLVRPKFDRFLPLHDRILLLRGFEEISHSFDVKSTNAICRDPKDDKFLNLAIDSEAIYITTGDKDLLVLNRRFKFDILTPAHFVERFNPPFQ